MKRYTDVTNNLKNLLRNFALHISGHLLEHASVRASFSQWHSLETYLGIELDNKLNWSAHTDGMCKESQSETLFFTQKSYQLPRKEKYIYCL